MKITHYIKSNPNIIFILIGICATVYLMLHFQWDFLAITIITLLLGYITNVFTGPGGPLLALFLLSAH